METARALSENLADLLRREHDSLAEFLIVLADFDRRRLWVELGYASLFAFLHRELRLSKAAAQYRKVAAELIQEVPSVVEALRDGRLCFTSIIELARVVTAANWETVLPRFYGLSRREAMEVVAALQPHPAPPIRTVATSVRPHLRQNEASASPALALGGANETVSTIPPGASLGCVSRSVSSTGEPASLSLGGDCDPRALGPLDPNHGGGSRSVSSTGEPASPTALPSTASSGPFVALARPAEVVPLTAGLSRLHLTVSKEFMKKLEAAGDAMSHGMPGATPAEILEAGLELLLAQAAKRKALVKKPRSNTRPAQGDHIPAHVRREVWKRDGAKCQWPVSSGGVCGATRHLELDHIHPRSSGGPSTAENLRVVCKSHNDLAARLALGDDLMDRYTAGLRGTARRPHSARANDGTATSSPP